MRGGGRRSGPAGAFNLPPQSRVGAPRGRQMSLPSWKSSSLCGRTALTLARARSPGVLSSSHAPRKPLLSPGLRRRVFGGYVGPRARNSSHVRPVHCDVQTTSRVLVPQTCHIRPGNEAEKETLTSISGLRTLRVRVGVGDTGRDAPAENTGPLKHTRRESSPTCRIVLGVPTAFSRTHQRLMPV